MEEKNRSIWVYDIETLASCFTYTAINIDTQEIVQYVIHNDRNDIHEFINHLCQCKGQIGFNNINFDYPVIHYLLKNRDTFKIISESNVCYSEGGATNPQTVVNLLFNEAQRIIEEQNKVQFNTIVAIKESECYIPQLDLFKMWHFNNKARRTSLKALEISMNYPNVMEMPIDFKREDIRLDEIPGILEYNLNDVLATYEFYKLSKDKIAIRKDLMSRYNIPCMNFPDSKIGEQLVLKLYCEELNLNQWDVKKLRTHRVEINLGDCIFDYIKFKTPAFNKILNSFKQTIVNQTKGAIEESVIFKGFKYDYGLGGIHGCIKPGVYESDNDYIIIDADVASLYPSIAVINKLYPEHLGESFCSIYESILKQRIEAKKAGNISISDAFKLALNSVYGKSNDEHSFLKDPVYTMKTTLNGQLMLSMLAENLVLQIPELQMLQINTDGLTIKIKKSSLPLYKSICADWEKETKLTLEFVEYSKMIIRDVNNYIAVKSDGKCKYKGAFEIDKELHKDNSFKIIPIALSQYFVKGIPVEDTIRNHTNIYDFCGRQKFTTESYGETHTLCYNHCGLPYKEVLEQQRNVRYYISNFGSTFIKQYKKGTSEVINKGYQVTIFNKYQDMPWTDYDINYDFYIKECYKEIDNIIDKQLTLF